MLSLEEKIKKHIIKKNGGCWEWAASKIIPPIITINKKPHLVRKILYTHFKKKSAEDYLIAICKNKKCVNPDHILNRDEMIEFQINKSVYAECWIWTGAKKGGYGYIKYKGKTLAMHRYMFEKYNHEIPKNMNICHKCDNPACVNPKHLWLGTQKDNIRDMFSKKRNNNKNGVNHERTKITEEEAIQIKKHYKKGIKPTTICRLMNLPYSTVYKICINENWKHIIV